MLDNLRGWSRRVAHRYGARAGFFVPLACALIAFGLASGPGLAQQGLGLTPDQMLQLGQQSLGQGQLPGQTGAGTVYNGQQSDMSVQNYLPAAPAVPLPPSRLEQIMSSRAGTRLKQFGYDQFGSGRSVAIARRALFRTTM